MSEAENTTAVENTNSQEHIALTADYPQPLYPDSNSYVGTLIGRAEIVTTRREIDSSNIKKVLNQALQIHRKNAKEIDYLWKYYKGSQPILQRTKEIRKDICNRITENHADEIVSFKTGYIFGEPVVYAGRAEDDCSEGIQQLNAWNAENNKETQDVELGTWMHTVGTGYKIVIPRSDAEYADEEVTAPYFTDVLDPRDAFVVYYNGTPKTPVLGVKIVNITAQESADLMPHTLYCCYTRNMYFEIDRNDLSTVSEPIGRYHRLNYVPIIEYPLNLSRRSAIEPVLPLLDSLNNLASNRMDGIEQFIQSFLLLRNVDISSDDVSKLQQLGAIKYKDVDASMPGDIRYITAELNQEGSQTLKDDLYESIIIISGMPNRNGGSSTSDTGTAVVYRDGWSAAETKAKETEKFFTRSEKQLLKVILRICKETQGFEVHLANIDIKFTRKNFENTTAKATVLTTMLGNEKIAPRLAFVNSGMFSDPEAAYKESMEYYASQKAENAEEETEELPSNEVQNAQNRTQ